MKQTDETIRVVLRLAALATFLLGAGTILATPHVIEWFVGHGVHDYHFVRFIGTALVGFSVANWLYSSIKPIKLALPAIYGNLTSLYLAIIIDAIGIVNATLGRAAWAVLGLHVVFAVAFTYCVVLIKRHGRDA
jgi:O-antigen/teichoic acid export membrane protein